MNVEKAALAAFFFCSKSDRLLVPMFIMFTMFGMSGWYTVSIGMSRWAMNMVMLHIGHFLPGAMLVIPPGIMFVIISGNSNSNSCTYGTARNCPFSAASF